jgi:hypothetical protein
MNRIARVAALLLVTFAPTACAGRIAGSGPQEHRVAALSADPGAAPSDVADLIAGANAGIVLLSADRDSAWFADVAAAAGLALSGPGHYGERGKAFFTNLEILGDTSLVLAVPGGGSVHMHDALYRVNGARRLDLMMVDFDAPDLRAAVRALFSYIATDVGATVPVLLAIDGATPLVADSVAVLMRAHYSNELECPSSRIPADTQLSVRLLYGPSARLTCVSSGLLPGEPPGVAAGVVLGR